MKIAVFMATILAVAFPMFMSADTEGLGASGQGLGAILGETCLVPVYNTDFAFPPEGGQIVRAASGQMYFVKNYLSGCANAGSVGTPVARGTVIPPATTPPFVAPQTGCK
jgi:hypothetical protein